MLISRLYGGYIGDNGKENGNYYNILGLYMGYIGIMEKEMETTNDRVCKGGLGFGV